MGKQKTKNQTIKNVQDKYDSVAPDYCSGSICTKI